MTTIKPAFIIIIVTIVISIVACKNKSERANSNSTINEYKTNADLEKIKLPAGYQIDLYAKVDDARSLAVSTNGIVFVSNKKGNKVYAVEDKNKDGFGETVYTVVSDMDTPNGIALKDSDLYIATVSSVYVLKNILNTLNDPAKPILIYDKYPTDKHHGWKYISFGPDGKLYVPVGDPKNISDNPGTIYSTLTSLDVNTKKMEIVARGIRNTVGFDWHPNTGKLWFTDNGRDQVADNIPSDELNEVSGPNLHFGHPYCMQGNIADPDFGSGKDCSSYTQPVELLGPHVAALGMKFYTGKMFDSSYSNTIFIAEHGSWNRSTPLGYRISTVALDSAGKSKGYNIFAEGWLQPDGKVIGRPVDIAIMPDGALLVSDDYSGAIYRISKK